jgi:hypothetical protein
VPLARFAVGDTVTVLVGSKAGEHGIVEHAVWSERDRCHYFYLEQVEHPPGGVATTVRKLSRGYRADELADGLGDTLS